MANKKPINKDNPKNIYCAHCKHYKAHPNIFMMICANPKSKHYQANRYYWHRCKAFEWEV